jgi:hypothetical protein
MFGKKAFEFIKAVLTIICLLELGIFLGKSAKELV